MEVKKKKKNTAFGLNLLQLLTFDWLKEVVTNFVADC